MERKRKIIIAISGHLFTDQRMKRIASSLSRLDFEIEIYYRDHFKYQKLDVPKGTNDPYVSHPLKFSINSGIPFYLLFNIRLFLQLIFKRYDILYAVDSDTLPAFTALSILRSKPLVYDAHEYFCEVPELKDSRLKKNIWHLVTAIGVKRAKICFTVGKMLALELEKRYGKKFEVLRNVPKSGINSKHEKSSKPIIIYQGALNAGRELEMLINAMKRLPEFHCMIVGEGDLSGALRRIANGLENVEFCGLMSPQQLKELTPGCFAGFNLLDDGGSLSYHFSLSNKYFDYMHAGVPSISSKLPEYLELNRETACGVCIDNSEEALVGCLKEWMEHPDIYEKLKENADIAKKLYNWEHEETVLKTLIEI